MLKKQVICVAIFSAYFITQPESLRFKSHSVNTRKIDFKNVAPMLRLQSSDEESSGNEEWALLEEAEKSIDRQFWKDSLKAKVLGWQLLKKEGILQRLQSENITRELINDIDEVAKVMFRNTSEDDGDVDSRNVRVIYEKLSKLQSTKSSALSIYNIINEVKIKGIKNVELMEDILLAISKTNSSSFILQAFNSYQQFISNNSFISKPNFYIKFLMSAASHDNIEAVKSISTELLHQKLVTPLQLLPSTICIEIFHMLSFKNITTIITTNNNNNRNKKQMSNVVQQEQQRRKTIDVIEKDIPQQPYPTTISSSNTPSTIPIFESIMNLDSMYRTPTPKSETAINMLDSLLKLLKDKLHQYDIHDINIAIKALGKIRRMKDVSIYHK